MPILIYLEKQQNRSMAITNAQQFKQLVNPPMEGKKRPGYRGDAAAKSTDAGRSEDGS